MRELESWKNRADEITINFQRKPRTLEALARG